MKEPDDTSLQQGTGFSFGFVDASQLPGQTSTPAESPTGSAGTFILKELIGVGGQGQVWEAWQSSLRRLVAVKIHKTGSTERFIKEAMLTGELDHPSIVPVLDLGALVSDGQATPAVAMAMKRLRGTCWTDLLVRERSEEKIPSTDFLIRHLEILDTVAQAVAYAHSKSILHLDLKPSQVIVGDYGEVYLCDWGMAARILEGGKLEFMSEPTGPFGTPSFMAPEQALGDVESVAVTTDIYLLGGLAYFILTGLTPHQGNTPASCVENARRNERRSMDSNLPSALRQLIESSLATAPGLRITTVEFFRQKLAVAMQRLLQEQESRQLTTTIRERIDSSENRDYSQLNEIEQQLDRAIALAPENLDAGLIRDHVLKDHALLAIERGDLELARVVASRIHQNDIRATVQEMESGARAALKARENQRIVARRFAMGALSALVVVLIGSSFFLYTAFSKVELENARAEDALVKSQQELARASLQAAVSYLDKQRPSDARESLRIVPEYLRGWEWGYLASRAVPERALLRPRTESYTKIALSEDGTRIGAIATKGQHLYVMPGVEQPKDPEPTIFFAEETWSAVASGKDSSLLAATKNGAIAKIIRDTLHWKQSGTTSSIVHLAETESEVVFAADAKGQLWRIDDSSEGRLILETQSGITVLSVNGSAIALGTREGQIWHSANGESFVQCAERHTEAVTGIEWHPNGGMFVSWATDQSTRQARTDSRAIIHALANPTPVHVTYVVEVGLTAANWSRNGEILILAFSNTWMHHLETKSWSIQHSANHEVGIANRIYYTPDGSLMVLVSRSMVQVRETEWFGLQRAFRVDSREIADLQFHDRTLILCGTDGGISEWSLDRAAHDSTSTIGPDRISAIDIANEASILAAVHRWGWIHLWDLKSHELQKVGSVWSEIDFSDIAISSDAEKIVGITDAGRIDLITRQGNEWLLNKTWDAKISINSVALHPNGNSLSIAPTEGSLLGMSSLAENPITSLETPNAKWSTLRYTPDGNHFAAGQENGTIVLFDSKNHRVILELKGHNREIVRINFDSTGEWIVSASADERAILWETSTGRQIQSFVGTHSSTVTSALITPDRRRVITACDDALVRIFDVESGVELVAQQGHQYGVIDMVWEPTKHRITSIGMDSILRNWLLLPWDKGDKVFDENPAPYRQSGLSQ